MKNVFFATIAFALLGQAQAATIAVIDSGLDYKHKGLEGHIWMNPGEVDDARDNDGNSYQDDIYGWNFANQNNQVIDYKYLGTFSADMATFFAIQGRIMLGTATDADKEWYKTHTADQKFIAELSKFGNFVHGTHVAGIAAINTDSQAMGVKIIPTEVLPSLEKLRAQSKMKINEEFRMKLLKQGLSALAGEQMKMLEEVALYIHGHKADIANGSFGTGFKQAQMITGMAFKIIFFRDATEAELNEVTTHFMNALITEGSRMMRAAPHTLFVFAAGNDGSNNDVLPTSPTNIKAENSISVAATYDNQFLAKFSNYGEKMVDVAAPGMLIRSTIPGDDYLEVSGTSQAAPFVANIAARIKEMNPALTPAQIKQIIMGTVDYKDFLTGKVVTGGLVNTDRAVMAGQLSKTLAINESISRSRTSVRDVESSRPRAEQTKNIVALPLMPMFR